MKNRFVRSIDDPKGVTYL